MAEPNTFLLRITDGTTTLNLIDGLNYDMDDENPWQPAFAGDEYTEVVEDTLNINVLGALTAGGVNYAKRTLRNFDTLRQLLRQSERAIDDPTVATVRLEYCPPNHGAVALYRSVILGTSFPSMPANINTASLLGANQTIEQFEVTLRRRTPWGVIYTRTNQQKNTRWRTDPIWTLGGAGTRSFQSITTPYDALGAQTITYAGAGSSTLTSPADLNTLFTSIGVPFTVMVRVAGSATGTITCVLRDAANAADTTTIPTAQALAPTTTIDSPLSQWLAFSLTPTSAVSGTGRLRFNLAATSAGTITIAEVLVVSGAVGPDDDRWHMVDSDLLASDLPTPVTGVTVPTVTTFTSEILSTSPTPIEEISFDFGVSGSYADAFQSGVTIINDKSIDLYAVNNLTATTFTNVADAKLAWPSGNVLRYAATSPNVWSYTAALTLTNPSRHIAILAVVRNNSGSITHSMKYQGLLAGGISAHESRPVTVPPFVGAAQPQFYHLGEIHHHRPFVQIKLAVQASAAGSSLDINRIIVIDLTDGTAILYHLDLYSLVMPRQLIADGNWYQAQDPQYDLYSAGGIFYDILPTIDNLRVRTRGQTVRVLIDGVANDRWRFTPDGTNPSTYSVSIIRVPSVEFPR